MTGAGDADRYQEVKAPDYMRVHHDEVFSYTQVDISPTSLHLRQIDENDKVIDEYKIERSGQGSMTSGWFGDLISDFPTSGYLESASSKKLQENSRPLG